jgi:hypothetical protein
MKTEAQSERSKAMNDAERWDLAKEWTGTFDCGEGRHPVSVSSVGFRYDGQGFFVSQFKSYRAASRELRERRLQNAKQIVATGQCPQCGTRLVHNSAMAGWWQCGAYACEAMRKPEFKGLPSCSFQIFTQ